MVCTPKTSRFEVFAVLENRFHLHGLIHHRSLMHFVKTLAIFTIIWEITMLVVAAAMLFIYSHAKCLGLDHLPYLKNYFRQMETPHHRIASGMSYDDAWNSNSARAAMDA